MANYTRQHDFSVKDALTTGDPDKVIKGSEVDEELDAVVTMSGTKVDQVTGHTTNNLASLNSVGNIEDAGVLKTDVCTLSTAQTISGNKTHSGTLTIVAPTADLHAATKQYADSLVAISSTTLTTKSNITATIPKDDTIPTSSEGTEIITVSHTPRETTHTLVIDVVIHYAVDTVGRQAIFSLFKDAESSAMSVFCGQAPGASAELADVFTVTSRHIVTAGTTSAITFKLRGGMELGTTLSINGTSSTRLFGGALISSITVREYVA